jgi:thioredoxin-related protein
LVTRHYRRVVEMKRCLRRFGLGLLILACAAGAAGAQPLEFADDLNALGRLSAERGVPIMLVFTRPDCPYSARAKQNHLEPLQSSAALGAQVIIREIETSNSQTTLRDFEGNTAAPAEIARRYDIRVVPTVLMVDSQGKPLADPVAGLPSADFYSLYLEHTIEEARLQLRMRRK